MSMHAMALQCVLVLLGTATTVHAQLPMKVIHSIDKGVDFLKKQQHKDGSWESGNLPVLGMKGGQTSLAVLALRNAGMKPDDAVVARGLTWLRKLDSNKVYVRSLQTMAFAAARDIRDKQRVIDNVKWLLGARQYKNKDFIGWHYDNNQTNQADGSNQRMAILALLAGQQAGAAIDRKVWEEVRDLCLRTQLEDGSWKYSKGLIGPPNPELTMTIAGLTNLLIVDQALSPAKPRKKNAAEVAALDKGMKWIGKHFSVDPKGRTFYHLYGVERLGKFSGVAKIGKNDWYGDGSAYLVKNQKDDGSWSAPGQFDEWPIVSTSFALLFLSKDGTPARK
jgi:hypothetical protein